MRIKHTKNVSTKVKVLAAFFLGSTLTGSAVYAATILFNADQVGFDNTNTSLSSTNVQGALDELYTRANTWIDPSTIQTNYNGKVFASSKGIIIGRKGQTHSIRINNWSAEKDHIQQIFSDTSCGVEADRVYCNASDLGCFVYSDGSVGCGDGSGYMNCSVSSDDSVHCGI